MKEPTVPSLGPLVEALELTEEELAQIMREVADELPANPSDEALREKAREKILRMRNAV